jgi:hypothetical protein
MDSLTHSIVPSLKSTFKSINFVHISNTFDLLDKNLEECLILDVADSISKVMIVDSENISPGGLVSAHDFDLGSFFEITGQKASIIAIPLKYGPSTAISEIIPLISSYLPTKE